MRGQDVRSNDSAAKSCAIERRRLSRGERLKGQRQKRFGSPCPALSKPRQY